MTLDGIRAQKSSRLVLERSMPQGPGDWATDGHYCPCLRLAAEAGAREDGLRLLQGLHLALACSLPGFEIVEREVALVMERHVHVAQVVEIPLRLALVGLVVALLDLVLGLRLLVGGDALLLRCDLCVGVLHEGLVCGLRILLSPGSCP